MNLFQGKRSAKQLQQAPAQGHSYEVSLKGHYIITSEVQWPQTAFNINQVYVSQFV